MVLLKVILSRLSERMVRSMTTFLDGEQVEPHEILSLEKVSDIIKELADELGVSKTYIEKIIRVVNIHSELLKKRIDYF